MSGAREFIQDFLQHEYDPVKAHEYYERTKKLKGRKAAVAAPASDRQRSGGDAEATLVTSPRRPNPNSAKQRREAAEARVAALQARLDRLNDLLAELVRQAKARSGVESEKKDTASKDAASKDKPRSAAEKRKAAKAARDAYEKEKKKLPPNKEAEAIEEKIKAVREKIQEMREELRAAGSKAQKKKRSKAQLNATAAQGR